MSHVCVMKGKESRMKSSSLANKSEPINRRIHFAVPLLYAEEENKHISISYVTMNLAKQ